MPRTYTRSPPPANPPPSPSLLCKTASNQPVIKIQCDTNIQYLFAKTHVLLPSEGKKILNDIISRAIYLVTSLHYYNSPPGFITFVKISLSKRKSQTPHYELREMWQLFPWQPTITCFSAVQQRRAGKEPDEKLWLLTPARQSYCPREPNTLGKGNTSTDLLLKCVFAPTGNQLLGHL